MKNKETLFLIGEIYHATAGTDESWAYVYFDTDSCELVVIESSYTTGIYPRYSGSGPGTERRMRLCEFVEQCPSRYRDKAIRLVTRALGQAQDGQRVSLS